MFRPVASILLCLAVIMFSACSGSDPNESTSPVSFNDLKNVEGPITQSDIDIYIKMAPEVEPVLRNDGKAAAKIYEQYGIPRLRYHYIQAKVDTILNLNGGFGNNGWPDYLSPPSEAELALGKENEDALKENNGILQDISRNK